MYDDDTEIIPRSTSVVARRFPASKPGHGRAARYVSGKMPVNAKNTHRVESTAQAQNKGGIGVGGAADSSRPQTEEEKIAAMFKAGGDQWEQTQQAMAKYVYACFSDKIAKTNIVPALNPFIAEGIKNKPMCLITIHLQGTFATGATRKVNIL